MRKIDIFRNGSVTLRIVQLAHAVGECILRRGGQRRTLPKLLWGELVHNHNQQQTLVPL